MKTENIEIDKQSSEDLALLLGGQYQLIMQTQNNIRMINEVLEQRKAENEYDIATVAERINEKSIPLDEVLDETHTEPE